MASTIEGHLRVGGSGGTLKYLDISENNYPKNQKHLVGKNSFSGFFFKWMQYAFIQEEGTY